MRLCARIAEIVAAVLHATPAWGRLPADTPPAIRRLLQRCLDNDLRRRLQSAADARLRLEVEAEGEAVLVAAPAREGTQKARRWLPWVAAVTPLALVVSA